MFTMKTTVFTILSVAIAASSYFITDPKYRYMSGRKIKIVLTLSVGSPQFWIAGLERQPSIMEHMHGILPSTRGATRVKLFHNVPHLDHKETSNIHEIRPGWLFACDNTIQPGCMCEFIFILKFIFVIHDKNFFCFYRFLCETVFVVEHIDTLVNCNQSHRGSWVSGNPQSKPRARQICWKFICGLQR